MPHTTPARHGLAFWAQDRNGAVLLRRRPARGLLGGMMEVPSTPWRATVQDQDGPWRLDDAVVHAPMRTAWRLAPGVVQHTFTHFHLSLQVAMAHVDLRAPGAQGRWVEVTALGDEALPSVMRKVIRHAMVHAAAPDR